VGRAGVEVDGLVAVVLGALVLVGDGEEDGGAEGAAVLGSGVDGDAVLFVARGCYGGLARTAAVELGLDVGFGEVEVWGAVFDYAGDGFAVGLAGAVAC
jgi:aspartate aminotransferase-like enzyme